MHDTIVFHCDVTPKAVAQAERILADYVNSRAEVVNLFICSGGGDSTAAAALSAFIRSMPYEVHTYTNGLCASGGVTLFIAGKKRFCAKATMFMLHGSRAPDGSLSPHASVLTQIYSHYLGWEKTSTDRFFTSVDEQWFDADTAISLKIATDFGEPTLDRKAAAHLIQP